MQRLPAVGELPVAPRRQVRPPRAPPRSTTPPVYVAASPVFRSTTPTASCPGSVPSTGRSAPASAELSSSGDGAWPRAGLLPWIRGERPVGACTADPFSPPGTCVAATDGPVSSRWPRAVVAMKGTRTTKLAIKPNTSEKMPRSNGRSRPACAGTCVTSLPRLRRNPPAADPCAGSQEPSTNLLSTNGLSSVAGPFRSRISLLFQAADWPTVSPISGSSQRGFPADLKTLLSGLENGLSELMSHF